MKYKVHRLNVDSQSMQANLESFLNGLSGEIVSIIPNVAETSLARFYGLKSRIDYLLVVEKTG